MLSEANLRRTLRKAQLSQISKDCMHCKHSISRGGQNATRLGIVLCPPVRRMIGNAEMAARLIVDSCNVMMWDENGNTMNTFSAEAANVDIVQILLLHQCVKQSV